MPRAKLPVVTAPAAAKRQGAAEVSSTTSKSVDKVDPDTLDVVSRYMSLSEAAESNGISKSAMSQTIRQERMHMGFFWQYTERPWCRGHYAGEGGDRAVGRGEDRVRRLR